MGSGRRSSRSQTPQSSIAGRDTVVRAVDPTAPASRPAWLRLLFWLGLALHVVLFQIAPMDALRTEGQPAPSRLALQLQLGLLVDELVASWFGAPGGSWAVFDRTPVLLIGLSILVAAWAAGCLLLRWLRVDKRLGAGESFVFGLASGLGLLSLYTLAMGLAGHLRHPAVIAGPLLGVIIAELLARWRGWRSGPRPVRAATSNEPAMDPAPVSRWPFTALSLLATVTILWGAMVPPWEFDVREYHMQIPKEWHETGRISFVPHNVYGNMPLGAEMHVLLAMSLVPGEGTWWWAGLAGKLVIACFAPLTMLALWEAGQRLNNRWSGWIAGLLFISTPWVAHLSMAGLIEMVWGCYLLLATYATLVAGNFSLAVDDSSSAAEASERETRRARGGLWALAGFLAGSAAACKYPALVLVVIPLMIAVWLLSEPAARWRATAMFMAMATLAAGPWFAKNLVLTGSPTYPLADRLFQARTPDQAAQWSRAHAVPGYSPRDLGRRAAHILWRDLLGNPLLAPLAAMSLCAYRGVRGRPLPSEHSGRVTRRWVFFVVALVLYFMSVWWLATHRLDRFWTPVIPLVSLLAGIGATWPTGATERRIIQALVLVVAGLLWTISASRLAGDNRFFAPLEQFRAERPYRFLESIVPDGQRVLLVGEAQAYDLTVPCIYNTCFDRCQFEELFSGRSADERREALRAAGISHILVHWGELARYRSPGNYGYSPYVTRQLIHEELIAEQQLLRHVQLESVSEAIELFEVRRD